MLERIRLSQRGANALIMAAAVADYRPAEAAESKLKKDAADEAGMTLELVENRDVIASIDAPLLKVGFAAETEDLIANAQAKIAKKGLTFIAANDVAQPDAGFAVDTNRVVLIAPDGAVNRLPLLHKYDAASRILDRLESDPSWR